MGYFNIDFNKFRSSASTGVEQKSPTQRVQERIQRLTQPIQTPSPIPRQTIQPFQQPAPPKPGFKQKALDFLEKPAVRKVSDTLNLGSEFIEKIITRGRGYEKALEDPKFRKTYANILNLPSGGLFDAISGKKSQLEKSLETEKGRRGAGFASRMIADPLNFIPFGKVAGLLGRGGKAIKGATGVGKIIDKVSDITKPAKEFLGKKFVRGFGLPEGFNALKTEVPTTLALGSKKIVENIGDIFSKYGDLSDEARDSIGKFLEPKAAGLGTDLGAMKKSLQASGQWDTVSQMLTDSRKLLDNEVTELVQRGRMRGDVAKDLLTRGGYFPHTDFAPKGIKKFFSGGRELAERRWYLKGRKGAEGFSFNAPKAIARRDLSQFQDNVIQDFLKTVKTSFGKRIGKGNPVPEGFHYFETPPRQLFELKGYAVPKRIADDLLALHGTNNVVTRIIDKFNRAWKPTATAWNPAFHLMNIQGNLFNSWIGGMKDPQRYLQAIVGKFPESEKAILEGSGILARGQFGADLVNRAFTDVDTRKLMQIFESPIMRNVKKFSPRQIGNFFENNARSAFFLNSREKFLVQGLSDVSATRKAIAETNRYLFDYLTGLAPFETNVMRRLFPFYTWSRFNIPLQFKNIVTQPQKYAAITKIYKELNKGQKIPEDEQGLGIPTPFVDENGEAIRWVPNLPVQDIFNLDKARFANMVNPLIKDGIQIGSWLAFDTSPQDTYTGRLRTDTRLPFGEQLKDVVGSTAKSLIRPIRSVSQFGDPNRTTESILDILIGGFFVNNEEKQELRQLYETRGLNSAIRNKMRSVSNDPTSTVEEKQSEINKLLKLME